MVIKDIGHRIVECTGENKSTSYLMQTIGMAIQCGNSCCILETVLDLELDDINTKSMNKKALKNS